MAWGWVNVNVIFYQKCTLFFVYTVDGSNASSSNLADGLVSSELRLMVNQSYIQSDAGEQLLLLVLTQEIIQLADEKVLIVTL